MDLRLAPVEYFDKGVEILERVEGRGDEDSAYLGAIAWFLAGLLRHEISSTAN